MRTLEDEPTLGAGLLNHYGGPEHIFDENETITLIPDRCRYRIFRTSGIFSSQTPMFRWHTLRA